MTTMMSCVLTKPNSRSYWGLLRRIGFRRPGCVGGRMRADVHQILAGIPLVEGKSKLLPRSAESTKPVSDPVDCKLQPGIILTDFRLIIQTPVIVKETGLESFVVKFRHVLARCVLPYEPFQSARIRVEVLAIPRENGSDLSPALCRIEPIQK